MGRWVHPQSLGSLRFALGVVDSSMGHWDYSCSPWVSLCSSRDVGFKRVSPGGRWVYPESLD